MKLGFWLYKVARGSARVIGIDKALRATVGPSVARFVFKRSISGGRAAFVNGHQMVLAAEGQYPPFAMATDRYEAGTTHLLERVIGPGMVVVDVGAHVGYYSLLAARQVRSQGKVYSFEPDPTNYRLLQRNIDANGYTNITAIQKAVSKAYGLGELFLSSRDNGTHSLYAQDNRDADTVAVDLVSLDEFLADEGWPQVDLIKMDVEGSELDALEGMSRLLRESPGLKIVMEFNPSLLRSASVDPLEFLVKLGKLGFIVSVICDQKGTTQLNRSGASSLTDALLKSERSVNLFCFKK